MAQGVNPEELDAIKVSQGVTRPGARRGARRSANDVIKRLFLLGTLLTMTQSMSDDLVELLPTTWVARSRHLPRGGVRRRLQRPERP